MDHKSHIDPVCGMRVEKTNAGGEYEHEGVMFYFDSDECMKLFYQDPDRYAHKSGANELADAPQASKKEPKLSSFERRAITFPMGKKRNRLKRS